MTRTESPVRYTGWFARDVLRFPGLLYLVLALGLGYLDWRMALRFGARPGATGSLALQLQGQTWNSCLTIAVLLAIGGVIGVDLQRGYYRSFFSKPMAPWWYYLQRYLLGGLLLLLVPLVLGLVLAITLHGGLGVNGHLFATIAMGYLLTGGACLLLGNFRPEAWLLVFIAAVAENLLGSLILSMQRFGSAAPGFIVWVHRLLPPFDLLNFGGAPLSAGDLAHVLIYGVAMLVAAMLVLLFRPLGSGGRS